MAYVKGKLPRARIGFVGLFVIGTLLYIDASNTFLTAHSPKHYVNGQVYDYHFLGQAKNRIRTITAGAIMTALCNCFIILAMGMAEEAAGPAAEAKAASL